MFQPSKRAQNVDVESNETTEEGCNFNTSDSESEFAVLAVHGVSHPYINWFSITASVKKLELANAAIRNLRCIQITTRFNQTFFKSHGGYGKTSFFCE